MEPRTLVAIIAAVAALLVITLLPPGIAYARRHPDRKTILQLSPGGLVSFVL